MPLDLSDKSTGSYTYVAGSTQGRDVARYVTNWSDAIAILIDGVRTTVLNAPEHDEQIVCQYVNSLDLIGSAWKGVVVAAFENEMLQAQLIFDRGAHADVDSFNSLNEWTSTDWRTAPSQKALLDVTSFISRSVAGAGDVAFAVDERIAGGLESEEVEPPPRLPRYPLLGEAIAAGRITGAGLPGPGSRHLRAVEEDAVGEAQQVGFGRSGEPPENQLRRRRLR